MFVETATDLGKKRTTNEDALWVGSPLQDGGQILVVCDGMGGHLAGEVASSLAIETIQDFPFVGKDREGEVSLAIGRAQERILDAQENDEYQGMGTTITLAWLTPLQTGGAELTIGHVGDSRAYSFCSGKLTQLTADHSVVGELVRSGTITASEANKHAKRHILTQALGSEKVNLQLITTILKPNCSLLLCTDGLTDVVDDRKIAWLLRQENQGSNKAQSLVDLANELGGPDNITVILAKV